MISVRKEIPADHKAVKAVNDQAFKQPQEGTVIDKLRKADCDILSLVAEINDRIVGHIFFSSANIDDHPEIKGGMGLAPMAVLPEYQKQGIGTKLITTGIRILKQQQVPFIIVLGHPGYYPKFGFEPASKYGLKCQWKEVPEEAFMVMIPDKEKLKDVQGVASYREEWNEAM